MNTKEILAESIITGETEVKILIRDINVGVIQLKNCLEKLPNAEKLCSCKIGVEFDIRGFDADGTLSNIRVHKCINCGGTFYY
jgi:hypothetical protein